MGRVISATASAPPVSASRTRHPPSRRARTRTTRPSTVCTDPAGTLQLRAITRLPSVRNVTGTLPRQRSLSKCEPTTHRRDRWPRSPKWDCPFATTTRSGLRDDLLDRSRARARHDPLTPKLPARSGRLHRRMTTIVQQWILDWRGSVQGLASVVLYYSSRIPTVPSSSPVLVRSTA
jgi:hypothetical protein